MSIRANVNDIVDYLEFVCRRDHWHIIKLNSQRAGAKPQGKASSDVQLLADWIVEANANKCGVYEQVNPPKKHSGHKAKRDDVKFLTRYHVDMDCPEKLIASGDEGAIGDWLEKGVTRINSLPGVKGKPSIVMTGNGLQAHWMFERAINATLDAKRTVEDVNARIAHSLGADSCHNCDRILRVPGTINWPNKKKRDSGYKPVMSELWQVSEDSFCADDFAELPDAPKKMKIIGPEYRVDWSSHSYTDDYEPVTLDEIERENPAIHKHAREVWDRPGMTRSEAAFTWLMDCITALKHVLDCPVVDMLDQPDIRRNLNDLVIEADQEWLGHYEDQPDVWAKLGWDIETCLHQSCDELISMERSKAKAAKKRLNERAVVEQATPEPVDTLTRLEHRQLFIEHVRETVCKDDLPNAVYNGGAIATKQSATETNVRLIMQRAGIVVRWNMMRDEPDYQIKERAGRTQAGDTGEEAEARALAPRRHFEAALAGLSLSSRADAAESLLADAIHEVGITTRRDMGALFQTIAQDILWHPIEDYATHRRWDGRDRIAELADVLETNHPLVRRYLEIFFQQTVGAVKSLKRYAAVGEGLMLSSVPILVGKQRMGKTSFWRAIVPPGMRSKGTALKLGGFKDADTKSGLLNGVVAICDEIGAGLDYAQQEDVKLFLTEDTDNFRVAYGRSALTKPRMTGFVGTSNELHLKDNTGSRRYLAMEVTRIDWDLMNGLMAEPDFVQQCYAQAWHSVMSEDAEWWLDDESDDIRAEFNEAYEDRAIEHVEIEDHVVRATGNSYRAEWLTVNQVFKVMGLKATPVKLRRAKDFMIDGLGIDYHRDIKVDGKRLVRVFAFPVTIDQLQRLDGR